MTFEIRKLSLADINDYMNIRKEMLLDTPNAFGMSYEEECLRTRSFYEEQFGGPWSQPEEGFYGVYENKSLLGSIGVFRSGGLKESHKVHIRGMYVRPAYRRRGLARKLLRNAIDIAQSFPNVTHINLSVESSNQEARNLYLSMGFKIWGTEPKALRVNNQYYTEDHMTLELK